MKIFLVICYTFFISSVCKAQCDLACSVETRTADCYGGSIYLTASGGTPPYQYSFYDSLSYSAYNVLEPVPAGQYLFWVKDTTGCTFSSVAYVVSNTINYWASPRAGAWEDAGSWYCGTVPGPASDVYIDFGQVTINSNVTVNSLYVNPGAALSVSPGYTLTILH